MSLNSSPSHSPGNPATQHLATVGVPLRFGSRGERVTELQRLLSAARFDVGSADGVFGQKTLAAVKAFQRANGLVADGVVGPKTADALDLDLGGGGSTQQNAPLPNRTPNTTPVSPREPPKLLGEPTWLALARGELGQAEQKEGHNARIVQYHSTTSYKAQDDETAWCSSFVNWCMTKAGYKGTNSAAADSWLTWGVSGRAEIGAIAVIYNSKAKKSSVTWSGNHVGFLLEETATHYKLLGGNQGKVGKVSVSSFPKDQWRLKGYRWPAGVGTPAPVVSQGPSQGSGGKGSGSQGSGSKGSAQTKPQVVTQYKASAEALIKQHVSAYSSMDEEGLAKAIFGRGKDVNFVTAVFKLLDEQYNSDADDVAVEYVRLAKTQAGLPLELLKKDGALRNFLIEILASGYVGSDESQAIQYLRGLGTGTTTGTGASTGSSGAPSSSPGDKVRSSNITVAGKHFVDWFNQHFQPANTGKHPTLTQWKKPAEKFAHTIANKEAFATIFDNCADLFAPQLTLNEFLTFFCIIYNETGGKCVPISERGGMKYMFERTPGGKASYNQEPNRCAGTLLRERGVIAANDLATFTAWNSTTKYPTPPNKQFEDQARECDFWKYRGRGLIQLTWRSAYLKHVDPLLTARGYKRCDELPEKELGRIIMTDPKIYLPMVKSYFKDRTDKLAKVNQNPPSWVEIGNAVGGGKEYGPLLHWRCETLLAAMKQAGYQLR